jgi:hypothetical protein
LIGVLARVSKIKVMSNISSNLRVKMPQCYNLRVIMPQCYNLRVIMPQCYNFSLLLRLCSYRHFMNKIHVNMMIEVKYCLLLGTFMTKFHLYSVLQNFRQQFEDNNSTACLFKTNIKLMQKRWTDNRPYNIWMWISRTRKRKTKSYSTANRKLAHK